MQSAELERVGSAAQAADTRGKHRVSAELKRLEQEARFLELYSMLLYDIPIPFPSMSIIPVTGISSLEEEELEQLEKMEAASAACKE
ncbi:hypothetical protein RJ639_044184 [Escallonia herrerae]|uniref:Uncharacterized protein n=1 Tax=Escallonia herrerae TaxID=1293975 RepID=A0AA88WBZ2_9ASTE|nr:hypothetical protein RJ639_044184 [Escallonia herrerae]